MNCSNKRNDDINRLLRSINVRDDEDDENQPVQTYVQWTTTDNKMFFPASTSVESLRPGIYEIKTLANGTIYFECVPSGHEGLIMFPETNSLNVVKEIEKFWDREELFRKHKLSFKRGILLYGAPGSGKTSTIKLAIDELIKRKGVVFKFCNPPIFCEAMRVFRAIQPNTPVIILLEDIDSIIENYIESDVINILDGVDMIEKAVFIATTNYPEKLGARILNRPSRFDKRFKIGMPNADSRRIYLQSLMDKKSKFDIEKWVKDTDGFSLAHIKELFVAVYFLGDEYSAALETLREMKKNISSEHDNEKVGLNDENDD